MDLLVLPASGGALLSQISAIQHLCEVGYKPDLMIGSSGGNLCCFIAAAADFSRTHVERIAKELKSSYFVLPWHSMSLIGSIVGFFNGNAFSAGQGGDEFLKTYFNKKTITKYQIITGAYNKDLQKFRLFFNCSKEESIINCDDIDYDITQSLPPNYACGDINQIAVASAASASIPGLVSPKIIDGYAYTDGASFGASPLTCMQGQFLKYIQSDPEYFHMNYLNSKDLSKPNILPSHNLFDTWKQAVNDLIKSQTLIDRLVAYELLLSKGLPIQKSSFPCDYKHMLMVKEKRTTIKYSLLEIYPKECHEINITNFTSEDITNALDKLYDQCYCNFWWIEI